MYSIGFRFVDPRDGLTYYVSIGSGFAAFYSGVLWTNAHVVEGLQEVLAEVAIVNPEPVAVRSGTGLGGDGTYVIVGNGWIHPEYDGTVTSEDIGLLDIDGEVPVGLSLLPREMVDDLTIGQPVGTLGFPGELGISNGDADSRAVGTFKDGVISALRAIDGGETQHVEVQYNFRCHRGHEREPSVRSQRMGRCRESCRPGSACNRRQRQPGTHRSRKLGQGHPCRRGVGLHRLHRSRPSPSATLGSAADSPEVVPV